MAIPDLILSAAGFDYIYSVLRRKKMLVKVAILVLFTVLAIKDFYSLYQKLPLQLVDDTVSNSVAIAEYLKEASNNGDTIYAVTDFPVLAFYSSRKTISLLPFQQDFYARWQEYMKEAGYYVYYGVDAEKDLAPQKDFLDRTANFKEARQFGDAIVYHYRPSL
jgi:hypothetical protein